MNKKFFMLLFCIIMSYPAFGADIWDDFSVNDGNIWNDQKPITNQEFEKAIETLTAGQKKKEAKQKKRKIRKLSGGGTSLHNELKPDGEILKQEIIKPKTNEGQLLNIPVDLIIDGKLLERGFYNIYSEKEKDGTIYLSFYQSQYFMGKVKAYETKNDYGAESIDFVKIIPYNDNYIKIVFGCIDYNVYSYIIYKEPQEN